MSSSSTAISRITRGRLVAAAAVLVFSGCMKSSGAPAPASGTGGSPPGAGGGSGGATTGSDASPGADRGSEAGLETPGDAGPARADGGDASGGDAIAGNDGPAVDGAVDPGPFGLAVRALNQTCKAPPAFDQPVAKLSATGCVSPTDVKKPAASLIPYDVASPLWSDGADKQRFLALPDGAQIHVKNCTTEPATCQPAFLGGTSFDEGHWVLPVGSVLVKNFLFAGKFVETRLFVRFADVWAGYSYQWNSGQTEATLVSEFGATAPIVNGSGATQTWTFPSRNDCLQCHNDTVGDSIGPDTRQFNWSMKYPSGVVANQISTLEHIGVFDAPVVRMPVLVDFRVTTGASIDDRARSYLHANCATCHRPDGNYSAIDLRFGVALQDMKICNLDPNKGDLGIAGAKRLVPGMPTKSLMLLRMQAVDKDSGRMPQLATSVLDTLGISLVSQWIQGITACP